MWRRPGDGVPWGRGALGAWCPGGVVPRGRGALGAGLPGEGGGGSRTMARYSTDTPDKSG